LASRLLGRTDLPGGVDDDGVPMSALLVSVVALAIAAAVNLFWRDALPRYSALVWLLALVPPFLLAYHRGWRGAAGSLAAGMLLLIGVEIGGHLLDQREIRWWIVAGLIVLLIIVSLGVGLVAEVLRRKADEALQMAYADVLTELPNRRILEMFLGKEFAAAERGQPLSVVLFDIDGFKRYNDREGHAAGDEILRLVAHALERNTRAMNLSGRWGGDEFLGLLSGEEATGAACFADRVREAVATAPRTRAEGLTLSVGVASYAPGMASPQALLEEADRALYRAKRGGGDRVEIASGASAGVSPAAGAIEEARAETASRREAIGGPEATAS
jgi:diguanylate cyclase (GGDEF)-like protein